jgi:hypothetical protein
MERPTMVRQFINFQTLLLGAILFSGIELKMFRFQVKRINNNIKSKEII